MHQGDWWQRCHSSYHDMRRYSNRFSKTPEQRVIVHRDANFRYSCNIWRFLNLIIHPIWFTGLRGWCFEKVSHAMMTNARNVITSDTRASHFTSTPTRWDWTSKALVIRLNRLFSFRIDDLLQPTLQTSTQSNGFLSFLQFIYYLLSLLQISSSSYSKLWSCCFRL